MYLFPFSRFVVYEESMLPVYKPGDHVLTFNWGKIAVGDVVVFVLSISHPALDAGSRKMDSRFRGNDIRGKSDDSRTYYIKRVYKCDPSTRRLAQGKVYNKPYNNVYIKGDNKAKSAKMMPIRSEQIVGKVILRY